MNVEIWLGGWAREVIRPIPKIDVLKRYNGFTAHGQRRTGHGLQTMGNILEVFLFFSSCLSTLTWPTGLVKAVVGDGNAIHGHTMKGGAVSISPNGLGQDSSMGTIQVHPLLSQLEGMLPDEPLGFVNVDQFGLPFQTREARSFLPRPYRS